MEDVRKAVHALLEDRLQRLRRHVAAGEAGAAGGDHHVDALVARPAKHLVADRRGVVGDDIARRPAGGRPRRCGRPASGPICRRRALRVSETVSTAMPTRNEGAAFVNPAHARLRKRMLRVAATNQSGWRLRITAAARLATLPVSKRPKQVAPEPDMRDEAGVGPPQRRLCRADRRLDRLRGGLEIVAGGFQPVAQIVWKSRWSGSGGSAALSRCRQRREHGRRRDRRRRD